MCKYCENPKVKKQLMKAGLWEHGVFFPACKDDIPTEDERFDFCPKCGTPLGEVKPLTVEQISRCEGKPIFVVDLKDRFKEWVKVQRVLDGGDITTAGGSRGYGSLSSYGTTWLAYSCEQKGEVK